MCLIKKHKKYQYLYLIEKLNHQMRTDMYNEEIGFYDPEYEEESSRIFRKNFSWLEKLNKKYNYDKTNS